MPAKKFADRKLSLAVSLPPAHRLIPFVAAMMKRLLLALVSSTLLLSTGCSLLSKKKKESSDHPIVEKESKSPAADNEEVLRRRWVEKRAGELTAQGTDASAARAQAEREFAERYGFNPKKK